MGTLFLLTLMASPFLAVFGLGFPVGLTSAYYVRWLRDETPPIAAPLPDAHRVKLVTSG